MTLRDVERGLVARYCLRLFKSGDLPLSAQGQVLSWLRERSESLDLPLPKSLARTVIGLEGGTEELGQLETAMATHGDKLLRRLRKARKAAPLPQPLCRNLSRLVGALGLPPEAEGILRLIAFYKRFVSVEQLCDRVVSAMGGSLTHAVSCLTKTSLRETEELLSPTGELVSSGVLQFRPEGEHLTGTGGRYAIPWRIDLCLDRHFSDFAHMRQALLGESLAPNLALSDYAHLAEDRDLIVNVLRGAAKQGAKGVNILLYGAPGAGKTELAKLAAATAGLSLYAVGQDPDEDADDDRTTRLSDLIFAQRLLRGSRKVALLFDEMEDVAWQLLRRGGSKLFLNRVLENNTIPVIWTSNDLSEIDPAVLRRMTLAVELKMPPVAQREQILRRLAKRMGVGLSEAEIQALARRIDATPAILENALRAARFAAGGQAAVERAALGILRAISGTTSRQSLPPSDFDLSLACTNVDLAALTQKLAASNSLHFSLLLSGPPGTGKSAFARHLARHLGLEVIHKRASDLLGAFVGESEKRIAEAFEAARESQALLIFDEAESFLFDRRDAVRSWEITQVNEMLTWMEAHPYPVCCTTNLLDRFDRASLRRFTFHVRFAFLDRQALRRAFAHFFQITEPPEDALALGNLTPGDFAQARRQAELLGWLAEPQKIFQLLADISAAKPDGGGVMGFVR